MPPDIRLARTVSRDPRRVPGRHLPGGDFEAYLAAVRERRPWLPAGLAWRLARNYGCELERILGDAGGLADLGTRFGADLYEAELHHLVEREWARTADNVLWRRSRLGLVLEPEAVEDVDAWLESHVPGRYGGYITGCGRCSKFNISWRKSNRTERR